MNNSTRISAEQQSSKYEQDSLISLLLGSLSSRRACSTSSSSVAARGAFRPEHPPLQFRDGTRATVVVPDLWGPPRMDEEENGDGMPATNLEGVQRILQEALDLVHAPLDTDQEAVLRPDPNSPTHTPRR